jgi:triosephosphate isomerase
MSRKNIVAGNWKMNKDYLLGLELISEAVYMIKDELHREVTTVFATPYIHLSSIQKLIATESNFHVAAQNCHHEKAGAYTGEISAEMIKSVGVEYVIIGHSERRAIHNEDDALINRKIRAALTHELTPIFCVGEDLPVRESGAHVSHVIRQVRAGLAGFHKPELKKIVIAYEPVWAIGTGKSATPEDAQEVCAAIREEIEQIGSAEIAANMRILYGGSVKSSNIAEIMKQADVDGALIGGASLDPEELAKIARFHAQA